MLASHQSTCTHERMTENVALSSKIGYVEYRRDAQGGFTLARMKKLLVEDAAEERT